VLLQPGSGSWHRGLHLTNAAEGLLDLLADHHLLVSCSAPCWQAEATLAAEQEPRNDRPGRLLLVPWSPALRRVWPKARPPGNERASRLFALNRCLLGALPAWNRWCRAARAENGSAAARGAASQPPNPGWHCCCRRSGAARSSQRRRDQAQHPAQPGGQPDPGQPEQRIPDDLNAARHSQNANMVGNPGPLELRFRATPGSKAKRRLLRFRSSGYRFASGRRLLA